MTKVEHGCPVAEAAPRGAEGPAEPSAWERTIDSWLGARPAQRVKADPADRLASQRLPVGLQFEFVPDPTPKVLVRLVVPGRSGWIRSSSVTWGNLRWRLPPVGTERRRLLRELLSLSTAGRDDYVTSTQTTIDLASVPSRRVWDLLAEADEAGIPMSQPGRDAGPVLVAREPARLLMRAHRQDGEIVLAAELAAGGDVIEADAHVLIGAPAHGVVWWADGEGEPPHSVGPGAGGALRLAPLANNIDQALRVAIAAPPVRVPAAQEERFLRHVCPRLLTRVRVIADDTVQLPQVGPSRLLLRARGLGGATQLASHGIALDWSWTVPIGDTQLAEPLWPGAIGEPDATGLHGATGPRGVEDAYGTYGTYGTYGEPAVGAPDADHRADLAERVLELVAKRAPDLVEDLPSGRRLAAAAIVKGDQLVRFLSEVLPLLREMDDIDVQAPAELLDLDCYELRDRPSVRFASDDSGSPNPEERDWYDFAVQITVAGEKVVFQELFVALAQDREYLLLPSGAYFSLDQPEFRQLRDLIAESRALEDAPPGTLRVGRYQAGLWAELADLGEVTGAAAQWHRSLQELFERPAKVALPAGLRARLRPYQREGLTWLSARYDRDLGGILADDMGLGKTVQALALACHAREHWDVGPFLVVAPASVVSNWVAETHRFTPDLDVRAITQTQARRGVPLAEAVAGADIVVTSYALFRLEYEHYEQLPWGALVLDEAQFVKNPYGKGADCARRLPAPVKLAITGTPMENNLGELWSLAAITAPGLFPRLDRFTDYYRKPIERGHDEQRLEQLRRRMRPFMLRRRKSDVALDLPPKQEQVVELDLVPAHRRVYQTYLQRERQKVLGLLGDMEKNRFAIFRSLTLLRQAALDVALVGHRQPVASTKLDHLVEQVADLATEGHRTLVFSQFTRFLTAARQRLERAGLGCVYLDGHTTGRAAVIDDFKRGTAPAFLISLKAGGFGLNLSEADYCILLDPWWNPATEAQAVDRVHRIGQTRNVMVYRLVARDTIEEKVMALKARKAELFRGVVDEGGFADTRLSPADIRALLD